MILFEKTGDILSVVGKEYVVHTVSGDYVLGAGIAKKINEMMDMSKQLHFHYDSSVNSYVGTALPIGKVFNLVVKETCRGKVDADDMYEALCDLRRRCERIGIKELSMPRIGCGGEHMDWDDVKDMLEDVFDDSDIEITVYTLPPKAEKNPVNEDEDCEHSDCNCHNCEECNCTNFDCEECECNEDFEDEDEYDDDDEDDEYDEDEEESEIVTVKPPVVTIERKVELYNNMLEFLAEMFDEETLYDKLLEIGFYPDEIEYEGYAGEDDDNTFTENDDEFDDDDEEEDCECDGECCCGEGEHECECGGKCGGNCHCNE